MSDEFSALVEEWPEDELPEWLLDISDLGPVESWIVREQVKRLRAGYHVYGAWNAMTKNNVQEALEETLDCANYLNAALYKMAHPEEG